MAIKRTRKQKQKAQQLREQLSYSLSDIDLGKDDLKKTKGLTRRSKKISTKKTTGLFSYDTALIYQDLRRTLVATAILVLVLLGLFWYL